MGRKILWTIMAAALSLPAADHARETKLQQAIELMGTRGDLAGAIRLLEDAAKSSDRSLAARSLLYLGDCREKLGQKESRAAYERIVREFADQKETAAQARARLGALAAPRLPAGFFQTQRLLEDGAYVTGPPSRDGRYLPWGDSNTGNLMIRDMSTGETRLLSTQGDTTWANMIYNAVISPDGKRVAYSFDSDRGADLFLVNLDGTGQKMLWKRTSRADWAVVGGWTPDGKSVVFLWTPENGTARVSAVEVATGQARVLAPLKNGKAEHISLSPDGRYAALAVPGGNQPKEIVLFDLQTGQETPLAKNAVGFMPPVFSPDSSTLFWISERRGERDLYSIHLRDGKPVGPEEPVKIDLGEAMLAGFTSNGTLFYAQRVTLRDIFTVKFDPASGAIAEKPVKLPTRISGAVGRPRYSPDGKKLLYARGQGRSPWSLVLRDLGSGGEREIPVVGNPNAEFEWMPDSRQVLLARSLLNLETGARSRLPIADTLNGQAVQGVAPGSDSNAFIITLKDTQSNLLRIVEYKLDSGAMRELYEARPNYRLGYSVLSPDGKSLALFEVELTENVKALVVIPMEGGKGRDLLREKGIYLGPAVWTPDSKNLLVAGTFLGEKRGIWLFPTAPGEKPRRILDFDIIGTSMSLHPDGRTLAFHSGFPKSELWTATNVLPAR